MARHTKPTLLCLALIGGLVALPTSALDFQAVGAHGTVAFEAPNSKSKKLYVLSKSIPVEVLVEQKEWRKVRDASGDLFWVTKSSLSPQRTLQVTALKANVHKSPDSKSPVLFTLEKGSLLDLVESGKTGWAKVKHRDGNIGFITIEAVWGL